MDEVLKAKRLTQEILARAASIKSHMAQVTVSMERMELMERSSNQQALARTAPVTRLLDLPDDCLLVIASHVPCYKSLCALSQTCRRLQRVINGDEQGWEKRCRRDWGIVDLDPVTVPCLDTMLLTNLKSLGGPLSGGASLSGGVGTSNGTSSTRHLGASQSWNTGGLPGTRGSAVGMAGGASERISRVSDSGGGGVPGAASRAVEAVAMEQQQQQQQGRGQQASSSSPAGSGNSGSAGGSAHQQLGSSGGRAVDVGHSSAGGGSGPPSSTTSPRPVLGSLPSPGKGNPTSPGSSSKSFQDRSSHGGGVDRMVGLMGSSLGTIREWQQLGGGWDAHDFLRDLYGASSGTTSLRSSSMHRRLHCTASTTSTGAAGGATSVQAGPASSGTAAQQSSNPPQGGAAGDQDGSAAVAEGGLGGDEGAMTTNIWRHIYKDRAQGWRLVSGLLAWLRDHGSPRSVSGTMHRLQLALALRYMMLMTGQPGDQGRKAHIIKTEGLKSLLSLLDNESGQVVESALHVLANLMAGDPEARVMVVIGSRMGKLFADKLDNSKTPGVVQQASRALINLWAEPPVPEVALLTPVNTPALPTLESGTWQLQEYSLRGDSMRLVHVLLSFSTPSLPQHGDDEDNMQAGTDIILMSGGVNDVVLGTPEEFEVSGSIDVGAGTWTMQRHCPSLRLTVQYQGHLDAHGAYGVYAPKPAAGSAVSFIVSSGRQPRVFRLFRDASLIPASNPGQTAGDVSMSASGGATQVPGAAGGNTLPL